MTWAGAESCVLSHRMPEAIHSRRMKVRLDAAPFSRVRRDRPQHGGRRRCCAPVARFVDAGRHAEPEATSKRTVRAVPGTGGTGNFLGEIKVGAHWGGKRPGTRRRISRRCCWIARRQRQCPCPQLRRDLLLMNVKCAHGGALWASWMKAPVSTMNGARARSRRTGPATAGSEAFCRRCLLGGAG